MRTFLGAALALAALLALFGPTPADAFGRRQTVQSLTVSAPGVQFQQTQTRGRLGGGFLRGGRGTTVQTIRVGGTAPAAGVPAGPAYVQSQLLINRGRRTQLQQLNSFGAGYLPNNSVQNITFRQYAPAGLVQRQTTTTHYQNVLVPASPVPQQLVQPQAQGCPNCPPAGTATQPQSQGSAQYLQQAPQVQQLQQQSYYVQPAPVVQQEVVQYVQQQPAPVVQQEVVQYVQQQPAAGAQFQQLTTYQTGPALLQQRSFYRQSLRGPAFVQTGPAFVQFQRVQRGGFRGPSFFRQTVRTRHRL